MGWKCQNHECEMKHDDDALTLCPACGTLRPCNLVLTWDSGRRDCVSKKRDYEKDNENLFKVEKDETGMWFLTTSQSDNFLVKIGEDACEPTRDYPLEEGMAIKIVRKKSPGRCLSLVVVSFNIIL